MNQKFEKAAFRYLFAFEGAAAYDNGVGVFHFGLQQQGYLLGAVLAVGVNGYGILVAEFPGFSEPGDERVSFAAVLRVANVYYAVAQCCQFPAGAVGGAVVHYNDCGNVFQGFECDCGYAARIVVCGYDTA